MFTIDLTKAAAHTSMPAIVRQTAQAILSHPTSYFKPGQWLQSLTNADLSMLLFASEAMTDSDTDPLTEMIIALTSLLAQGEGLETLTEAEDVVPRVGVLVQILLMESIARKGLIEITYDNISFDEVSGDRPIAKRIDATPPVGE